MTWEEIWKNLTAYSTNQNKKKVFAHEGCIFKIEGAKGKKMFVSG